MNPKAPRLPTGAITKTSDAIAMLWLWPTVMAFFYTMLAVETLKDIRARRIARRRSKFEVVK